MPEARFAPLALLACILSLFVAACSDSSRDDAALLTSEAGILRYVPADTPYVVAMLEPAPAELRAKVAPHVRAIVQSYAELLQAMVHDASQRAVSVVEQEGEGSEDRSAPRLDEETARRISTMIGELAGKIGPDGMPDAGIDSNSTAALYGVGLLPVLRVTLSDAALFEAEMAALEEQAGAAMDTASIGEHSYRYADTGDARIIIAVLDDQLVVTVVPGELAEPQLQTVLGLSLPPTNIARSGELAALAEKYELSAYAVGMIDVVRIAATFLDDQTGVNAELLRTLDYDSSALSDICKAEIRSIAGIAPRMVTGYTEISATRITSNSVIELRSDLADGLQTLTAAVPGLGTEHGGLLAFGMSLDLLAAREMYAARLDALEADPYQCELFADLQAGVAQGRELLNQPLPPIAYGIRGFLAVIDDMSGMDLRNNQPPTDIDMRLLLAAESPDALLAMAAMFSPEVASLNLQGDSKPVKLEIPAQVSQIKAAFVAMSNDALALSLGAGNELRLEAMLGAASADPSPFMSMSMDADRYYGFINDVTAAANSGEESPEALRASSEITKMMQKLFTRIAFDVRFTGHGIEVPSTVELAD